MVHNDLIFLLSKIMEMWIIILHYSWNKIRFPQSRKHYTCLASGCENQLLYYLPSTARWLFVDNETHYMITDIDNWWLRNYGTTIFLFLIIKIIKLPQSSRITSIQYNIYIGIIIITKRITWFLVLSHYLSCHTIIRVVVRAISYEKKACNWFKQ